MTLADRSCGPFRNRISPQLLLYRLTQTFGMAPACIPVAFQAGWETELLHRDCVSQLSFSDHMGAATVSFSGHPGAGADAVDLINFLTRDDSPHPFANLVAGPQDG